MGETSSGNAGSGKTLLIAFLVLAVLGIGVLAYRSLSTNDESAPTQTGQVLEAQNGAQDQGPAIEAAPAETPAPSGGETGTAPSGSTESSGEAVPPPQTGD